MAAIVANVGLGKVARYADLPLTNEILVYGLLVTAGLVSDATLKDYTTVSGMLAGASDEATFTGYARVTATSVTVTIDQANDRTDVDTADPQWSPTSAQALGKLFLCYEPDSTAPADANKVPLFYDDFSLTTPTSGTVTYQVAASGFFRAS